MDNQLILATPKTKYGNTYNFQFNSCLKTKREIALHSIHHPKFVIPRRYKLFFKVNFLTNTIANDERIKNDFLEMHPNIFQTDVINAIEIDFGDYPVNSGDDLLVLIYSNFVRFFKEKYPYMLDRWKRMGPGVNFQGAFPIAKYGEQIIFDVDKLYIDILDTDFKLEQLEDDDINYLEPSASGISEIIKRQNIFNLIKNAYEIEINETLTDMSNIQVTQYFRIPNGVFKNVDIKGRNVECAYILSNIIEPSYKNKEKERILDVVTLNGQNFCNVYEVKNLTFHQISTESIFDFKVVIKSVNDENIAFHDETPLIFKFIIR